MSTDKITATIKNPLNVAVVGTGLIGRKHIALITDNPKFKLTATVNPSGRVPDIAISTGAQHFLSCASMLAECHIDAAIVASPNETHAEIAVGLIQAGIPTLVEKPIAGTIADGMKIIAASEECGTPVLMGHHRRYNPIIARMQEIVKSGDLGALVAFSGVWSVYKPDPYYDAAWRTGPTGGPILINLIHEIDYLQAILGRIIEVGAMSAPKRRSHSGEEAVAVILRFESGVVGSIVLSDSAASPWSWEQATGENDPAFPMNRQNSYRFLFERGGLEFPELKVWQQTEPSWNAPFEVSSQAMLTEPMRGVFAAQIDHFYSVANRTEAPLVTAQDGLAALNAAIAVKEAIVSGGGMIKVPTI